MKIAIYSGQIPSTTFIERLIISIAGNGNQILLFGKLHSKVNYSNKNIKLITQSNHKFSQILLVSFQILELLSLHPARFFKYFSWCTSNRISIQKLTKQVPVVLHLPDVFHVQWAKSAIEWLFLKELFGIKLALSLRGTHITISPWIWQGVKDAYLMAFPHYDAFHLVCESMRVHAFKLGCNQEKCTVIYSGINLKGFPQKQNYEPKPILSILVAGRFHYVKGYDYMLEALHMLKINKFPFHLTLIAGGNNEEFLLACEQYDMVNDITLIPAMEHQQLLQQMATADALLLPSIEEGIANIAIEAMASGLPVLSSDAGGMPELVQHQVTGLLFARRNPSAMAESIHEFQAMNTEKRLNLATRASESLKGRFDAETFSTKFRDFYSSLH